MFRRGSAWRTFMLLGGLGALGGLAACFLPDKRTDALHAVAQGSAITAGAGGMSGIDAFTATLRPLTVQKCAACHGVNQSPRFAVPSVDEAYNTILGANLVSFTNVASSKLVMKRSDSHCGATCTGDAADFKSAIQAWWDQGQCRASGVCAGPAGPGSPSGVPSPSPSGGGNKSSLVTVSQLLPANLPTDTTYSTFTWNLTDLDPSLTGAKFLVDVQVLAGSNAYQLRRPRITIPAAQTYSIYVEDLTVWINGAVDPNATTYSVIERTIAQPGGQYLSTSTMIVLKDKGPGADQLAVAFGELKKSAGSCKALAKFTAEVRPVLNAKCVNCHGSQTVFRINASDTDDLLCARALQRVDFGHPSASPLITLPKSQAARRDGSPHDPTTLTDADVTSWLDWIAAEAP